MKLKHLLFGFLAATVLFVGCDGLKNQNTEGAPKVEIKGVENNTLTFAKEGETKTITMRANRDWRVTITPESAAEWINMQMEGEATSSDGIKLDIVTTANAGKNRTAKVKISAATASKTLTVTQEGEGGEAVQGNGTAESPYNVAQALEIANALASGAYTDSKVYVRGIVSGIKDASGIAQYGNISFWISDDGSSTSQFLVFQATYLDGAKFTSEDQIKTGDDVVIYGRLTNYMGNTPETEGKGSTQLYSINGEKGSGTPGGDFGEAKGSGTEADPFNVAAINEIASALASGATSEQEYYMAGTVAKIREVSATHGNARFDIKDDDADGTFYIFRCKYIGGENFVSEDQIKVGDKVVVKGYVTNYLGNTPETTQGAEIISINGSTEVTKVLSVSTRELTAIADDESATFKVGGNVAWTASVTEGSDFVKILSGASGNGAGDVVLELSKNTADTPRTAKITVTTTEDVAEKSIEVVLTQLKKGEVPAGANITWAKADWNGSGNTYTLTKDGYTITIDKAAGGTPPALRDDNSVRLYAKGLLTISGPAFTSVEIVLAGDAGYRYCPVTADSGTVGAQASDDKSVYWTGSASTVAFTVGEKAEYGSDGADKSGQLRFVGINIK